MTKFKKGLCIALAIILGIVALGSVVTFAKNDTEPAGAIFKRGGLDPSTGKYVETNQSLYTEKAIECYGLRIEPEFDSTVTFDVFYYDSLNNLLECKLGMSDVYEQDCSFAEYARIVIHPDIPEDVDEDEFEIGIFDITKYTSMLNITVSKDKDECEYDFVNYYKSENAITGKAYENPTSATWNADTMKDGEGMLITEKIDVKTKYDKYIIWLYAETDSTNAVAFGVFDESGNIVGTKLTSGNLGTLNGKPRWVKYQLDVSDIEDADGLYIRGTFQCTVDRVYIYGYND